MDTFYAFVVGQMKGSYGSTALDGTPLRSLAFLYIKEQEKIKKIWLSSTHFSIYSSIAYNLHN